MAHDPLSHVASWIAPTAANLSITADVDDPLVALIRERDRLYRLGTDTRARGGEIEAALPDDVRFKKVRASFLGLAGDEDFRTEEELREFFSILKLAASVSVITKKLDKAAEDRIEHRMRARVDHLKASRRVKARPGKDRGCS